MVDLEKLNSIIDELDSTAHNFSQISAIVEEVKNTADIIDNSSNQLDLELKKIDALTDTNVKIVNSLMDTYKTIEEDFKQIKIRDEKFISEVNQILLEIKNESYSLNKQLENSLSSKMDILKSDVTLEYRKFTTESTERIEQSQLSISKQMENSLNSKIDSLKSDITSEYRAAIEELKQLYVEILEQMAADRQQKTKQYKIMMWVLGISCFLSTASVILLFFH